MRPGSTRKVEVWFSSEYRSEDGGWYENPQWAEEIEYKLEKQPDLTIERADGQKMTTINIDPSLQYQTMLGFGSSIEESTVYNLWKMTPAVREEVLRKLVDPEEGIGMNLMRICFGSSDFTARPFYSYDDMPPGQTDPTLNNFSIQKDRDYKIIPTIRQMLRYNPGLKILASPWSPPGWMKTSDSLVRGRLKTEYIPVLAQYYRKAIQAYAAEGIPISLMTLQNEPLLEIDYPSCYLSADQSRQLVKALRAELVKYAINTGLLVYDHNPEGAVDYIRGIFNDPEARKAADGVAFHDYHGDLSILSAVHRKYPEKNIYLTERSVWGTSGMNRIINYIRNWACSYNMWVTMLDSDIATHQWVGTPGPSLFIQKADDPDHYWVTPEYYLLGQYAKFVQRGAKRIFSDYGSTDTVTNVAFLNPDNTMVVVVVNQTSSSRRFRIVSPDGQIIAAIPAKTVATYRWPVTDDSLSCILRETTEKIEPDKQEKECSPVGRNSTGLFSSPGIADRRW